MSVRATVEPQITRARLPPTRSSTAPSCATAPRPNTIRPGQSPKSIGVEVLFVIG